MSAPEPYWSDAEDVRLFLGDCREVLRGFEPESFDAVICDPPYGLEFMGREWDAPWLSDPDVGREWQTGMAKVEMADGARRLARPTFERRSNVRCRTCGRWRVSSNPCTCPRPDFPNLTTANMAAYQDWCTEWAAESLRVLKPGGWVLAFGGTRTWHRLACAIEDAGFEIRDSIDWIYGSGFPKSHDVSKAIDKEAGIWRGKAAGLESANQAMSGGNYVRTARGNPATAAAAAAAAGLGTALKPAHEPIVLARKPLAGTVAQNVQRYGTGALNIDACRVGTGDSLSGGAAAKGSASHADGWDRPWKNDPEAVAAHAVRAAANVANAEALGRWPSNVVLSHSPACAVTGTQVIRGDSRAGSDPGSRPAGFGDVGAGSGSGKPNGTLHGDSVTEVWSCAPGCPVAELDRQSGVLTSGANPVRRNGDKFRDAYGEFPGQPDCAPHRGADSGGASRFFPVFSYQAKAGSGERPRLPDGTAWPTVKPLALMRWLVRLVTPPGGLILDPFCGTGTTASAAVIEGFRCVLIEQDPVAAELAKVRLAKPVQPVMFGGDL